MFARNCLPVVALMAVVSTPISAAAPQLEDPIPLLTSSLRGANPGSVLTDVNGDGVDDLVFVNAASRSIEWAGTLGLNRYIQPTPLVTEPALESFLSLADLDGDGDGDLIYQSGPLLMALRRGPSGFESQGVFMGLVSGSSTEQIVTDMDGDGDADVLLSERFGSQQIRHEVSYYENTGNLTIAAGVTLFTSMSAIPLRLAAADVQGDGIVDVVVSRTNAIELLRGLGGGTFAGPAILRFTGLGLRTLLAADADLDGDVDLLYGDLSAAGALYAENDGTGVFTLGSIAPGMPDVPVALAVRDVNFDGVQDLVASSETRLYYYPGVAAGGFGPAQPATQFASPGPNQILMTDVNGDGLEDVFAPVPSGTTATSPFDLAVVLRRPGSSPSLFEEPFVVNLEFTGSMAGAFGQFDGDRALEFIVGSRSGDDLVAILERDEATSAIIASPQPLPGNLEMSYMLAGDLNGNGRDDAIAVTASRDLVVLPAVGRLRLGTPRVIGRIRSTIRVMLEDLDLDGDLDIVAVDEGTARVSGYLNEGGFTFSAPNTLYTGARGAVAAHLADLDDDGDRDLAIIEVQSSGTTRRVVWSERVGTNFLPAVVLESSAPSAFSVTSADLDGDGLTDLIWSVTTSPGGRWARGLGGGSFAAPVLVPGVTDGRGQLFSFDEDGDGDTDLLELKLADTVDLLTNLGSGTVFPSVLTQEATRDLALADQDGDGDADLLAFGVADNTVLYLENASSAPIGTSYCGTAIPNSSGGSAAISALGKSAVVINSTVLRATSLPPSSFGFFLVSNQAASVFPVPASEGRRCVGGAVGRYVGPGQIQQSDSIGGFDLAIDWQALPQPNGAVMGVAGQTWNFQAWFRDVSPIGAPTSNFTNGLSVTLQ